MHMSAKQKYWLVEARSGTVLFIGAAAMMVLCQAGDNAIGYTVGAIALVASMLVFTLVDRKNAQKLDRR
jgi:hypothetical protein